MGQRHDALLEALETKLESICIRKHAGEEFFCMDLVIGFCISLSASNKRFLGPAQDLGAAFEYPAWGQVREAIWLSLLS